MKLPALAIVAMLAACSNTTVETAAKPAPEAKSAPEWITSDYAKPGAPLSLAHREVKRVSPGDAPEVVVGVAGLAPGAVVAIDLTADSGLDILGTQSRMVQADDRGIATFTVDVRAMTEGRHYLNVFAGTGELGKRVMTVPVQVGDALPVLKPVGVAAKDSEGRTLSVMEAEETIDGVPQ